MKKVKNLAILFTLSSAFYLMAQTATSDWKTHYSYERTPTAVCEGTKCVYALSDSKLFAFNKTTNAFRDVPAKTALEFDIQAIGWNAVTQSLLIVRNNLDIDILDDATNTLYNAYTFNSYENIKQKTITNINTYQQYAFLSAPFGMLMVDMQAKSVCAIVYSSDAVCDVTVANNTIYAATSAGVKTTAFSTSPQTMNAWATTPLGPAVVSPSPAFTDSEIERLAVYGNRLYILVPSKGLYYLDGDNTVKALLQTNASEPFYLAGQHNMSLTVFQKNGSTLYRFSGDKTCSSYTVSDMLLCSPANSNETLWCVTGNSRLCKLQLGSPTSVSLANVYPRGPASNYAFYMAYTGGKIRVTGGAYWSDNYGNPFALSEYAADGWFVYPTPDNPDNWAFRDYAQVIADPTEPDHLFVSSWGCGIFEFRNRQYVRTYNNSNSSLEDIFNAKNYVRCSAMAFDHNNRLWILEATINHSQHVFEKSSPATAAWKTTFVDPQMFIAWGNPTYLAVDQYNNKWSGSERGNTVMFIFNENNTVENLADDKKMLLQTTVYTDREEPLSIYGGAIFPVYDSIAKRVWLLTNHGLYYVDPQPNLFEKPFRVKQFFLTDPQTGHSTEPLLSGLYLKTMAIDNFGGKWIVPSQHGIYHISTDNSAILEHFTAENSPLPSNNVLSVAVAGDLVFIGTDRGIVSFAAAKNGSKPAHSVNDIYPLSVSLNDNIPVTISSLVPNSLLRITDRYGNSVFDTLTDAGSYVWNLSDMLGNKVKPDIYYIYGTQNGKTGLLGSVVISSMTD